MAKYKRSAASVVCQQCGSQQQNGWENVRTAASGTICGGKERVRGGGLRSVGACSECGKRTPLAYNEIESQEDSRQTLGISEFDRCWGRNRAGLAGSTARSRIGKSTLLLEVRTSSLPLRRRLYGSGEESERQIKLRGERAGHQSPWSSIFWLKTCLERIFSRSTGSNLEPWSSIRADGLSIKA